MSTTETATARTSGGNRRGEARDSALGLGAPNRAQAARRPMLGLDIGPPVAADGAAVHDLVASCPPLDPNSMYANLLQCTHFASTCAVARQGETIVGWVSGYIPPAQTHSYFLWQVAIHPDARGRGLPRRLIEDILSRPECARVSNLKTTITADNQASWRLFRAVAAWLRTDLQSQTLFHKETHFDGRHPSEYLVAIGPFHLPLARLHA